MLPHSIPCQLLSIWDLRIQAARTRVLGHNWRLRKRKWPVLQHAYARSAGQQSSAYLEKSLWNFQAMKKCGKSTNSSGHPQTIALLLVILKSLHLILKILKDQWINGKWSLCWHWIRSLLPGLLLSALHSWASWNHQQLTGRESPQPGHQFVFFHAEHSDWELHVPSPLLSGFPIIAELNFWSKSLRKFLDTRNQVKLMLAGKASQTGTQQLGDVARHPQKK